MSENEKIIRLDPRDNVVVALDDLQPGTGLEGLGPDRLEPVLTWIPAGHKVAATTIDAGAPIIKYGRIMGFAKKSVALGEHVHTHNVELGDFDRDYAHGADVRPMDLVPESERATFGGYVRSDGRVGTRNYIGILPTVSCSAGVARLIAEKFPIEALDRFLHVDGVVALAHGSGCCDGGEGLAVLRRTLAGYAHHPNFAGVMLVGLGCEINLVEDLMAGMNPPPGFPLSATVIQDRGGTEETVRLAVQEIHEMLEKADRARRSPVTADRLLVGLECGGSDAYSGISANPVMGRAVDLLVKHGGTAILSETPEIYGAEHLLTRRAVSRQVGEKLVERIHWWEAYAAQNNARINNNPSPGNKAGGITTIFEKSLGAVSKAGRANLVDVYQYAEPVTSRGLVFMDTPGYDPVSITGMIAGGANLICFTTGRGSVYGTKPVPTLKLASNSPMYRRLKGDMDFNAGRAIDGDQTMDDLGRELFLLLLETASGKKTRSEILGFGDSAFVPWHLGAVL